jgi:hypothetical protein
MVKLLQHLLFFKAGGSFLGKQLTQKYLHSGFWGDSVPGRLYIIEDVIGKRIIG